MVGDVNVFYSVNEDNTVDYSRGEIEVMIAEESVRRRGVAKEAVELMMRYAHDNLGTSEFEAKILEHNEGSIKLFTEKLGFEFVKRNLVFKEIVLVKRFR
jgi:RimJ/RimL family protein N-acetyltransferase